jgi:hypothetical protein
MMIMMWDDAIAAVGIGLLGCGAVFIALLFIRAIVEILT